MPNTVIQLKKSGTASAIPGSLEFGELAINYADGKLFYKAANGTVVSFASGGGSDSFGTVNANGTLVVADTPGDVLTLVAGTGIAITGDAINDRITISSTSTGGASVNVGSGQPVNNSSGDLWWNSDLGRLLIYYSDGDSSQWVDASPTGEPGPAGPTGPAGNSGNIQIGTVTTGAPGTSATVTNSGNGTFAVLNFTIPTGNTGATGNTGNTGDTGPQGPAGISTPRSITIELPTATEKIPMFYAYEAITLRQIESVLIGSSSPSVTFSVRYGSDLSASGTEVVTSGITVTNTTFGLATTSFNNGTIAANSFVWITTSAVSGTVNYLNVSLIT
jgi:hypothetical protein